MKKHILILSLMAASLSVTFTMPFSMGYSLTVSAEEADDSADEQSVELEEEELDEETIAQYTEGVTDEDIISYSVQNIETLVTMDLTGYDPEVDADARINDWFAIKDQVGAYISCDTENATVEHNGRKWVGVLDAECENAKVHFRVTFDVINGLESISAVNLTAQEEANTSLADKMKTAGVNTLLGMGTVFVMLIVMSFVISLMKYIPQLLAPKQKAPESVAIPVPVPTKAAVPAPAVLEEDLSNDEEIVAVISAAIKAYEGENAVHGFVVRSIRKH